MRKVGKNCGIVCRIRCNDSRSLGARIQFQCTLCETVELGHASITIPVIVHMHLVLCDRFYQPAYFYRLVVVFLPDIW
jgi:hypothetical protein